MTLGGLDFFFWAAGFLGHIVLLAVLFVRGQAKNFPLFTALTASHIAQTVILYCVHRFGAPIAYFRTYWSFAIFEVALQLGVFYEIASIVFKPLGVWAPDVRFRLWLLVLGSVTVAATLAYLASPPTQSGVQSFFLKGNLFAAVLMSELFVLTTSLSTRVGLAWKSHVLHLAQGLGIYSIATLVVETADTYFGLPLHANGDRIFGIMQHSRMAVYLSCLCYWIVSLSRAEVQRRPVTPVMRARLFHLQGEVAHVARSRREDQ